MPKEIEIRRATHLDAEEISKIEKDIFSDAWSKENYENLLRGTSMKFYVAYLDSEMVGYGGYYFALDEADIIDIGIKKDRQGMGFGSKLLEYMLGDLKDKNVFLEVRESNDAAINLYKKFNFKKIGLRKKYYTDPTEDAIVMFLQNRKEEIYA